MNLFYEIRLLCGAFVQNKRRVTLISFVSALGLACLAPSSASAQCSATGTLAVGSTVTCAGTETARVGQGPGADNVTVNIKDGATLGVSDANSISLGNNATITLGTSGAGGSAGNLPVIVRTTTDGAAGGGQYGDGSNTIDVGSNGKILINRNASVIATGTQPTSEAINPYGPGNTIVNYGLIQGGPSSALYFENVGTTAASPRNVVDNFGIIQVFRGGAVDPAGQAIGSSGNVGIDFTNETGAKVIGNLQFQGGDDRVTLNPGSLITGNFDGGGGNNLLTLNASGTSADLFSGAVQNFQTLNKTGSGTWTLTGSIGNNGAAVPLAVNVIGGTLVLTGNNALFNGSIVINPGSSLAAPGPDPTATLQARAQSLPPLITDHGNLLINQVSPDGIQPTDGTYAGVINGTGILTKIGTGTTTLTGVSTYTGGTYLNQGAIALAADSALGAATTPLIFNGGTLRYLSGFNLAATHPITLNGPSAAGPGGGTFDTNGNATKIAQAITGAGGLTKDGIGRLALSGTNTYTGGTTILGGTLQLGDAGTTGSILGDVADLGGGTLQFNRTDSYTFPGVVSGTGSLVQYGTGTTILTGASTYTGGTTILAGTLQLGGGGTTGSIVGNVTDSGTLAFNRSDAVTFPGVISGVGAVTQIGTGITVLNAVNPYTGTTTVTAGTLAVGDAAHPTAALSGGGAIGVASGGTLGGYGKVAGNVTNSGTIAVANALFGGGPTGSFTVRGNLVNQGLANLAGSGTGNVLSVAGNYTGSGASLRVNTVLNAGGALSNQFTDRLLIAGSAAGNTSVQVHGIGAGAFTATGVPDANDGISLIQVAGASTATAFTLSGGYVSGGTPYQYRLYAYGPGSPNGPADAGQNLVGNAGGQWDYRLQNAYVSPGGTIPPVPVPPGGGAPALPPNARLEVAPQIPAYITVPSAMFGAGFQDLDSLHRRLGEIRDDQILGRAQPAEFFIRSYGSKLNYTSDRSFLDYGFNSTQDYAATQFGGNWIASDDQNGTLRVGVAGVVGQLWLTPSAVDGVSNGQFTTETIAALATWQSRAGWYVDAILTGGLFDGRISTPTRGQTTALSGNSMAASVEAGYPIALHWQELAIEPQLQLVYQHLDFGNRIDSDGIGVNLGSPNQGVFRGGARLTRPFVMPDGARVTPYIKANLLQGIGGGEAVHLSNIAFPTGKFGTALQVGGGVTGSLSNNLSLYADVAWQQDVGASGSRGWAINGGLRYAFGSESQ